MAVDRSLTGVVVVKKNIEKKHDFNIYAGE